jgi:hypothetical protein
MLASTCVRRGEVAYTEEPGESSTAYPCERGMLDAQRQHQEEMPPSGDGVLLATSLNKSLVQSEVEVQDGSMLAANTKCCKNGRC